MKAQHFQNQYGNETKSCSRRSENGHASSVSGVRSMSRTMSLLALAGMIPKRTVSPSAARTTENSTESESKVSQRSTKPSEHGGNKLAEGEKVSKALGSDPGQSPMAGFSNTQMGLEK